MDALQWGATGGASVLKPYVGDVEGKDTCAQQHRADGGARGVVASVLVSVREGCAWRLLEWSQALRR